MKLHLNIKVDKSGEVTGEGNLPMKVFSDIATKIALSKGFDNMIEEAEKTIGSEVKEFNAVGEKVEGGIEITFDPPLHKDDHALFATLVLSRLIQEENNEHPKTTQRCKHTS